MHHGRGKVTAQEAGVRHDGLLLPLALLAFLLPTVLPSFFSGTLQNQTMMFHFKGEEGQLCSLAEMHIWVVIKDEGLWEGSG